MMLGILGLPTIEGNNVRCDDGHVDEDAGEACSALQARAKEDAAVAASFGALPRDAWRRTRHRPERPF